MNPSSRSAASAVEGQLLNPVKAAAGEGARGFREPFENDVDAAVLEGTVKDESILAALVAGEHEVLRIGADRLELERSRCLVVRGDEPLELVGHVLDVRAPELIEDEAAPALGVGGERRMVLAIEKERLDLVEAVEGRLGPVHVGP